jgi:hypothetical protein
VSALRRTSLRALADDPPPPPSADPLPIAPEARAALEAPR